MLLALQYLPPAPWIKKKKTTKISRYNDCLYFQLLLILHLYFLYSLGFSCIDIPSVSPAPQALSLLLPGSGVFSLPPTPLPVQRTAHFVGGVVLTSTPPRYMEFPYFQPYGTVNLLCLVLKMVVNIYAYIFKWNYWINVFPYLTLLFTRASILFMVASLAFSHSWPVVGSHGTLAEQMKQMNIYCR